MSPPVRGLAAGLLLLVVLILVSAYWVWPQNILVLTILSILVLAGVTYLIVRQIIQLQRELLTLQDRIDQAERKTASIGRRSDTIFQLSRKFVAANDENEVLSS